VVLVLHDVASFCPELRSGRLERSGFGAYALRRFGTSTGLRILRNAFSTLVFIMVHTHGMAYSGREASHAVRRASPVSLPQLPQEAERSRGLVWNFNKRPICATLFVFGVAIRLGEAP
jgi:hypothetical protein